MGRGGSRYGRATNASAGDRSRSRRGREAQALAGRRPAARRRHRRPGPPSAERTPGAPAVRGIRTRAFAGPRLRARGLALLVGVIDDFLRQVRGYLLVVRVAHREEATA